jgi:thiamine-phosphate pyrophosphorylase
MMDIPRLHLVTPPGADDDVIETTRVALAAGAPLVQARTKDVTDRVRYAHTARLVEMARAYGVACLVNDRADMAFALEADGVHAGLDDMPTAAARAVLGDAAIVGATCRNPEQARRAEADGASYIGTGPAYATTTKSGLPEPVGPAGIAAVAAAVSIPVIAIAGITAAHIPELLDAGAWGVAVVGAVYRAPDPGAAVAELLEALQ